VILETERMILRLPEKADAPAIARYFTDNWAHLAPWMPTPPPDFFAEAHWRTQIARLRDEAARESLLYWFVFKHDQRETPLGGVQLSAITRGPAQMANLGYHLAADAQGQGYLTEALPLVVDSAFGSLGLHRIQASYMPRNERSGRLLRRLGFQQDGYARYYLRIAGRWEDHVLTSRTNPDWTER
jgi:ribosomal-protein-alanine N-acetyltransferase